MRLVITLSHTGERKEERALVVLARRVDHERTWKSETYRGRCCGDGRPRHAVHPTIPYEIKCNNRYQVLAISRSGSAYSGKSLEEWVKTEVSTYAKGCELRC